jgi:hypothetical protein
MRAQISNRDYEQISAYIDGQLAPGDQRKLEERLRTRPELQEVLNELRQTRALLRMAPRRQAPRNFTLTPAMVGETGPKKKTTLFGGLFPTLSFASAVAAFALVATLLFQLIPGSALSTANVPKNSDRAMSGAAPTAAALQAPALPEAAAGSSNTANGDSVPPIINWSPGGMGGGGGAADSAAIPGAGKGGAGGVGGGMGGAPAAGGIGGGAGGGGGGSSWVMGGGAPDGQINLPPQSVQSLPGAQSLAAQPAVQPDASITGSGPILGVPAAGEGGQIIKQDSPAGSDPGSVVPAPAGDGSTTVEEQPAAAQPPLAQRTLWGFPVLRLVQILLAVVMVTTGATAFIVRRRTVR